MFLGIEIGGTKLQLGVGRGEGAELLAVERYTVDPARGATGILEQIERAVPGLIRRFQPKRMGIGFGGPVDSVAGRVLKSHQIAGWENILLADWCQRTFGLPTMLGNDCDVAALAEARYGAGRARPSVFFVTVGTGVGGGLVLNGKLHGAGRPAIAEIGHLRPGPQAESAEDTVESHVSGWGLVAEAVARLSGEVSRPLVHLQRDAGLTRAHRQQRLVDLAETDREYAADLLQRCEHDLDRLTAKMISQAAAEGNEIAREVIDHSVQVLGWAIAQVITLVAPEVVVVGGGVSLMGEQQFFAPLREYTARYVFPPLTGSYSIVPAELGELVVVCGAIALAAG